VLQPVPFQPLEILAKPTSDRNVDCPSSLIYLLISNITEAAQPTPISSSETVEPNDNSYGLNFSRSSDEIPLMTTMPSLFQNTSSKNPLRSSGNRLSSLVNGLSTSFSRRQSRYFTDKNQPPTSIPLVEIENGSSGSNQRDDDQAELIHQEHGIKLV